MRAERQPWPENFLCPSASVAHGETLGRALATNGSPRTFSARAWPPSIDGEYSSKAATAQLGHSGSAIMVKHYIEKADVAPDLTKALEKFATVRPPALPLELQPDYRPIQGPASRVEHLNESSYRSRTTGYSEVLRPTSWPWGAAYGRRTGAPFCPRRRTRFWPR